MGNEKINDIDESEEIIDLSEDNIDESEELVVEEPVIEKSKEELLEAENLELKDKLVRAAAEFDNFRKRSIKEKQTIYQDGVKDTVEKLLSTIDNFDRAMKTPNVNTEDSFYVGMDMIFKQFNATIADLGVKELGAVGDEFDPTYHFAVAKEDNDAFGENQISEILQKGYKLNDKVIRPTMVKVAN